MAKKKYKKKKGAANEAVPRVADVREPSAAQARQTDAASESERTSETQAPVPLQVDKVVSAVQAPGIRTERLTPPEDGAACVQDTATEENALPDIQLPTDPSAQEWNAPDEKRAKHHRRKRHSRTWRFCMFALGVTALSVVSVLVLFQVAGASLLGIRPDVDLPNFLNMTREEIEQNKEYKNFRIEYEEEYNAEVEAGVVFDQRPKAPKQVKDNARITLIVSKGVEHVVVPNVSGWAQATAREKLRSTGLTLLIKREESDTVEAGSVIRTVPEAGTYVEAGTTVTVYVSRPKEDTASLVPSCVGLTQSVALQKLSALRLSANFVTVSSTEPQGTVLSQSPAAGTLLAKGGSVTLRVSSGQDPDVDPSGHVHQWLPTDENGWRVCYICLERQQVG